MHLLTIQDYYLVILFMELKGAFDRIEKKFLDGDANSNKLSAFKESVSLKGLLDEEL